jgi:hypothetical protein
VIPHEYSLVGIICYYYLYTRFRAIKSTVWWELLVNIMIINCIKNSVLHEHFGGRFLCDPIRRHELLYVRQDQFVGFIIELILAVLGLVLSMPQSLLSASKKPPTHPAGTVWDFRICFVFGLE